MSDRNKNERLFVFLPQCFDEAMQAALNMINCTILIRENDSTANTSNSEVAKGDF